MRPILFSIGSLPIHSYGFCVALGVLVSIGLMRKYFLSFGFTDFDFVLDLVFVTLGAGFLGGRIYYIFQNISYYKEVPLKILAIWEGGLIFYGGVIGALTGLYFFTRRKKFSFLKALDWLLPFVALTHAFGRIGCFLNGCCSGKFCDYSWCMQFTPFTGTVHPTQLYEAFYLICLSAFLSWKQLQKPREGVISAYYFVIYGIGRFVLEFFREENPGLFGLTHNQWIALVFVLGILGFPWYKKYLPGPIKKNLNPY